MYNPRIIVTLFLGLLSTSYFVSGDYFTTQNPITCSGPRIRRSYGDLTYTERSLYTRLVYQMKIYKDAWKMGTKVESSLYDTFVEMHTNPRNANWHFTSFFLPAHKAMLWLYESALVYVALNQGYKMDPEVTIEEACSFALPYWEWETAYDDNQTDSVIPVLSSSVFQDLDLNGGGSPEPETHYVNSGYFSTPEWELFKPVSSKVTQISNPNAPNFDKRLKRDLNTSALKLDPTQIMYEIVTSPAFEDFLHWVHGAGHSGIHLFISHSMMTTASPDDPMFFLHHANIDRLYHLWADCHEYDKIPSDQLGPLQYTPINPTDANTDNPHIARDLYGNALDVNLDRTIPLYLSSSSQLVYIPEDSFPTVRELWSLGSELSPGWNGLFYRYGPDKLASSPIADKTCPGGNTWDWVNFGTADENKGEIENEDLKLFDRIEMRYRSLTEGDGLGPLEALEKMAREACERNPGQPLELHHRKYLKMMGITPATIRRICDNEETNPDF